MSLVWLVIFFAVLFGNMPLAKWIDHHKPAVWIQVVYGCLFFGFLFGNVFLLRWSVKGRVRKYRLFCPACGKPLTLTAGQIAIATGDCGHCGASIFQDSSDR